MALPHLPRRSVVRGLVVLAVIAIGFAVAALTNPWHLTSLYPLASRGGTIGVLAFAGLLLATAAVLHRGGVRHAWVVLIVSVVAIPALAVGLPLLVLDGALRHEGDAEVLAVSPNGGYSAVKSTLDTGDGTRTRVYIRSRAGLFSRESSVPAAECPYDPFARGLPPEAVRFTSEDTLAVPLPDRPTAVVRFDTGSLTPERTIGMCDTTG